MKSIWVDDENIQEGFYKQVICPQNKPAYYILQELKKKLFLLHDENNYFFIWPLRSPSSAVPSARIISSLPAQTDLLSYYHPVSLWETQTWQQQWRSQHEIVCLWYIPSTIWKNKRPIITGYIKGTSSQGEKRQAFHWKFGQRPRARNSQELTRAAASMSVFSGTLWQTAGGRQASDTVKSTLHVLSHLFLTTTL